MASVVIGRYWHTALIPILIPIFFPILLDAVPISFQYQKENQNRKEKSDGQCEQAVKLISHEKPHLVLLRIANPDRVWVLMSYQSEILHFLIFGVLKEKTIETNSGSAALTFYCVAIQQAKER